MPAAHCAPRRSLSLNLALSANSVNSGSDFLCIVPASSIVVVELLTFRRVFQRKCLMLNTGPRLFLFFSS